MNIHEITNETIWTDFFNQAGSPSFHHAWEWGELQKTSGYQIKRVGIFDGSTLKAIALLIYIKARRGNFIFIPHGPVFSFPAYHLAFELTDANHYQEGQAILHTLTDYLIKESKKQKCAFFRIAPPLTDHSQHQKLFTSLGYRTSPIYMHAEHMWVMDIRPDEEMLLTNMRKNCRYAIRSAIKADIQTHLDASDSAVDRFWNIYRQTFTRESFTPFSRTFISHEFDVFRKRENAIFIFGELPSKFDQEGASREKAGSLVIFTKDAAFYHQGASLHTREPVAYMVQWRTILEAKKRGCQFYNLYGIHHPGRTPRSWEGLSLFKRGFGGFELNYLPTQDFVLSPSYWLTALYERYLNWKRGVYS